MTRAERIIRSVAAARGVLVSVVLSESQSKIAAAARAEAACRIHEELHLSTAEIGRLLDRHHTSVIAMLRKARKNRQPGPFNLGEADYSGEWAI